jgi:hypothetical protein
MSKVALKIYMSKEEKAILDKMMKKLGKGQSDMIRLCLIEYAKSLNLITEVMHS